MVSITNMNLQDTADKLISRKSLLKEFIQRVYNKRPSSVVELLNSRIEYRGVLQDNESMLLTVGIEISNVRNLNEFSIVYRDSYASYSVIVFNIEKGVWRLSGSFTSP